MDAVLRTRQRPPVRYGVQIDVSNKRAITERCWVFIVLSFLGAPIASATISITDCGPATL